MIGPPFFDMIKQYESNHYSRLDASNQVIWVFVIQI